MTALGSGEQRLLDPEDAPVVGRRGAAAAYGLERPTSEDLKAALQRTLTRRHADEAWAGCCRRLGLPSGGLHSPTALEAIAVELLRELVGPSVLAVRNFLVRLRTYHSLEGDPL